MNFRSPKTQHYLWMQQPQWSDTQNAWHASQKKANNLKQRSEGGGRSPICVWWSSRKFVLGGVSHSAPYSAGRRLSTLIFINAAMKTSYVKSINCRNIFYHRIPFLYPHLLRIRRNRFFFVLIPSLLGRRQTRVRMLEILMILVRYVITNTPTTSSLRILKDNNRTWY